jgi:mannose-6-phosphate isomerase-like protein (cupin superfamily)
VSEGLATVEQGNNSRILSNREYAVVIPVDSWHRLSNRTNEPVRIIEIQYGTQCIEEDIVSIV